MSHSHDKKETWAPRVKATHTKVNGIRFVAGELVMLSRKNVASGKLPYFVETQDLIDFDKTNKVVSDVKTTKTGDLDRGIPIFLTENPKEVMVLIKPTPGHYGIKQTRYMLSLNKKKKSGHKSWLVKFILDGKMHRMYLTKSQYHRELVRALPVRIKKNYNSKKEST